MVRRYNSKFEAFSLDLQTHADGDTDLLPLRLNHVHYGLENENVLLLHLFNLQLKISCKFCTVLKLWKLNHFAFFDVDSQNSWLVHYF
jgi:hypothetical protein